MRPRPKVARPPGLALAIIAAVIFFSISPAIRFYLAWRLNRGIAGDGEIIGAAIPLNTFSYISAGMALVVLLTAIVAWIGKPPQARLLFLGAVVAMSGLVLGENLYRILEPTPYWSSSDELLADFLRCQFPFQIAISLYIIWYCNRAPARAFYQQKPLTPPDSSSKGSAS
jgi:hypothetical protein